MAKKKRRRRSTNIWNVAKKASYFAAAAGWVMRFGFTREAGQNILRSYTGYSTWTNKMEWSRLVEGWGPRLGVEVAQKVVASVSRLLGSLF